MNKLSGFSPFMYLIRNSISDMTLYVHISDHCDRKPEHSKWRKMH